MRKLLCTLLLCAAACTALADDFGQSYDAFEASYAENIVFINENTARHLLPHTPTRDYDSEGRRIYVMEKGALSARILLDDLAQQIASCQIVLTAPDNMPYGSAEHNNFNVSGYHSYALLMAMDKSATPAERYALIDRLNLGLSAGDTFETQVGDYSVTAVREGASVSFLFENQLLVSSHDPITPDEDDDGEGESNGEEGDYLG